MEMLESVVFNKIVNVDLICYFQYVFVLGHFLSQETPVSVFTFGAFDGFLAIDRSAQPMDRSANGSLSQWTAMQFILFSPYLIFV